ISPAVGRSSPAIERSVVVLPQPEGPSSVNSLPSGTSNDTSCAAFTTVPLSLAYSVKSDFTLSTAALSLALRNPESPAQKLGDHHQAEQQNDQHDAERRELDILPVLPKLPDHDRHHLGARAVKQNRARQLTDRDDQHIDPAREQAWFKQRQHHAAERHCPGRAAHGGRFLELLVDL